MLELRAPAQVGGLEMGSEKEMLGSWVNAGTQGLPPDCSSPRARAEMLNWILDYREGLGNAGAIPCLDKDFIAFFFCLRNVCT